MVVVKVNGHPADLPEPALVTHALEHLGAEERRVAVAVNGEVVPRRRWAEHVLAEGDAVEVVAAIQGGA